MNQNKKIIITLVIVLVVLALVAGVLAIVKGNLNKGQEVASNTEVNNVEEKQGDIEVKLPKTFAGNERPMAVMIDNHIDAMPQSALLEADIVYEIIVEGGETRLMAVLKGKDLEKIGPIRSSRHYFLDYAMENDALYVHFGWSPQARSDISSLGINNLNGLVESESSFWRVSDKEAPHNAVSSTEALMKLAKEYGYRTTTEQKSVLNYVVDEVELTDGEKAENSDANTVEYKYDEKTKLYTRYSRGEKQVDWTSGKDVLTKNIIITFIENSTIPGEESTGRQTLDNIGTADGYYITNGKAIKIKCEKSSREAQTVYKDLEGNEIKVNDGKTFIQICPINGNVSFGE